MLPVHNVDRHYGTRLGLGHATRLGTGHWNRLGTHLGPGTRLGAGTVHLAEKKFEKIIKQEKIFKQ